MLESKAKTKWCPFARVEVSEKTAFIANRFIDDSPATFCIGSRCMAWRDTTPENDSNKWESRGFCGLAGDTGR